MKNSIFVTVDLSAPRKLSTHVFNYLIFQLKMKDPGLYRYRTTTIMALFSFVLKNEASLIVDSSHLIKGFNLYDMSNYIQAYGMQNYYLKLEMMKIKDSLFQSFYLLKVPSGTNHINVRT